MRLRICKWSEFQHYKDRNPPWIKLHYAMLSSRTWVNLNDAGRVLAIASMLIASKEDGEFDADADYFKRVAYLNTKPDWQPLIKSGFCEVLQADASTMQADARPETEQRRDRAEERQSNSSGDFECFWRAYPKKRNKGNAEKAWKKLNPPLAKILDALEWQRQQQSWTKDGGQFVPYPASYLNAKGWEDEPIAPPEPFDPFANLTRAVTEAEADWMMGLTDEKP